MTTPAEKANERHRREFLAVSARYLGLDGPRRAQAEADRFCQAARVFSDFSIDDCRCYAA